MSENLKNNLLKKISQTDNEEDIYELFSTDFNNDTINEKDRYKIIKSLFHKFPKIDISRKINEKTIFDLILEKIGKEYRSITIKTLSKKIINAFKNYKDKETLIEKFLIDNNIYIANFLIRHFTLEDVRSIKSIKSIKNKKKLFEIIIALNNFEIFREIYNSGTKLENSELFDITKIAFEYKSAEIINFLKEKNEFNDINFQQLSQTLQKVNDFDIKLYDNIMLEKDIESTETSFKINKNRQGINQIKFIEREIEYNDDAKTIKTVKDTAYANLNSTEEERKLYEVIYENDGTKKIIYYDKDKNPLVTANIAEDNTLTFTDFTKNYSEEKIDEILNDDYLNMETFDYNLSYLSYAPLPNKENVIFKTKYKDINSIVDIISESNNEKNKGKTFICDFGIDGHNIQILVSNGNVTLLNTGFDFQYIRDEIEQKCKEKGLENVNIKHVETTNQAVGNCVEASKLYTVALAMEYENKYKTLDGLSKRLNRFEEFMENILNKRTNNEQIDYLKNNFTKEDEEILDILSKAHEKLLMKEEHFEKLDCRFSKFLSIFENIPEIKSAKINNMINSCDNNAKEINRIEKSREESLIYNITDTHGDSLSVAGALKQSGFIMGVNETKVLYYDVDKDEFLDTIPSLENMTLEEFKKRYTIISDFDIPDFENIPKGTFICTSDMQNRGLKKPESFAIIRLLIKKYEELYKSSNKGIDSEELEQKAKEFVLKKININIFNQSAYLLSKDEADVIVKDLKIDNGKYSKSLINIFEKGYIDIFDYGIMLISIMDEELIEYAKTKYNNNPLLKLKIYKLVADRKENQKVIHNCGLMFYKGEGIPVDKKEAAKYIKMAANKGSINAMRNYGYMLENGEGVLMDKEEAVKYYKMATDRGSIRAMYRYGLMLKKGEGITVDKKEAAKYIKMAADKGNVEAMRNYGYMLENGDDVKKNLEEAIIYYKMAADKGNADDMYNYGLMLDKIKEIPGDKKREAVIYYKMAADRGNADAMYRYGLMLEDGEGIGTDKEEAARYYEMAAEKGQITALCNYGSMLYDGEGVKMNKEEAAKYYKMAADKGSIRAMYSYGYMLENGEGIPMDKKEAARYYEMVVNNKDINIINSSCLTLENTRGVFKEKEEVVTRYYKMVTGQEDVNIMNNYNSILDKKEWVPISKEEILGYYKVAADNGNICAMFEYGAMMLNEETGIAMNKEEAIKYIKMAADKGDIIAMEEYSAILESGNGVPVNKKEAAKYCKMAADKGNIYAMYDYGVMLEKGYGVKINENEAIRYFKMAADLDYDEAKKKLNSINAEKNKVKTDSSTPSPEGEHFFKILSEIEKLIDNEQISAKNASEHVLL